MEWMEGEGNLVVDIGFLPEMSLTSTGPSTPQGTGVPPDVEGDMAEVTEVLLDVEEDVAWQEEITHEEALRRLETHVYPFKQVAGFHAC